MFLKRYLPQKHIIRATAFFIRHAAFSRPASPTGCTVAQRSSCFHWLIAWRETFGEARCSVEFADFRSYHAGDDIRRIDWNAYGRFDKLFLKMFLEEEDLDLTLLLDASLSMNFGEPSKLLMAQQLAAAIGYIGLSGYDRVSAAVFDENVRAWFPPSRGAAHRPSCFVFWKRKPQVAKPT
jgi:hypothetical protein